MKLKGLRLLVPGSSRKFSENLFWGLKFPFPPPADKKIFEVIGGLKNYLCPATEQ
jgi:hypothetical protein